MTDIESTSGAGQAGRTGQAKQLLGDAGNALKQEAQTFAGVAQERALAEAQRRAETATKTLGDFANAIRRAGDELSQADQSPAARLVSRAADGLEGLAHNLAGKPPEEILNSVRDFGRRNPVAFIGGAVLVGLALGRFVRASDTSSSQGFSEDIGGPAYPLAAPADYGQDALGEDALGLAEESRFDGAPEAGGTLTRGTLAGSMRGDVGDLSPSDVEDSTSVLGVEDSASDPDLTGRGR